MDDDAEFHVLLDGGMGEFSHEHFLDLEDAGIVIHADADVDGTVFAFRDLDFLDGIRGVSMHVADGWFQREHFSDAGAAFGHVRPIGHKQRAGFDGMDAFVSHVADDGFHNHGTHGHLLLIVVRIKLRQVFIHDGHSDLQRMPFVFDACHGHADIVKQGGEENDGLCVFVGTKFLRNEGRGDAGVVQQLQDFQRVEGHDAHVDGAMVIVSKADDGNVVGLILPGGQFLIEGEFAVELMGDSFERGQDGAIQFFFTGGSNFHKCK